MTTGGSIAGAGWRSYVSRQPQWWFVAAAAAAWIALLVAIALGGHGTAAHHHQGASWTGVGAWTNMVMAMMLPFASREARWLAFRSLRRRRQHALTAFAAGFLL